MPRCSASRRVCCLTVAALAQPSPACQGHYSCRLGSSGRRTPLSSGAQVLLDRRRHLARTFSLVVLLTCVCQTHTLLLSQPLPPQPRSTAACWRPSLTRQVRKPRASWGPLRSAALVPSVLNKGRSWTLRRPSRRLCPLLISV